MQSVIWKAKCKSVYILKIDLDQCLTHIIAAMYGWIAQTLNKIVDEPSLNDIVVTKITETVYSLHVGWYKRISRYDVYNTRKEFFFRSVKPKIGSWRIFCLSCLQRININKIKTFVWPILLMILLQIVAYDSVDWLLWIDFSILLWLWNKNHSTIRISIWNERVSKIRRY